jgi:hypothetical protein
VAHSFGASFQLTKTIICATNYIYFTMLGERSLEERVEITTILSLPLELISDIAMLSGFWGAMNLKRTCKSLSILLSNKQAWRGYYHVLLILDI